MEEIISNETVATPTVKEFREERFEFALYVNNNLICKRNFKINNYIDESMHSIDFKHHCDEIVGMIQDDLKSKSRVYTWYYFDENDTESEFNSPLIEPWECTFKFVITDNKNEVYNRIWDGGVYPKSIREKVDIANKTVKIVTKDGRVYSYDKETYFEDNKDRLTTEMYILKAMIMDKQDLLFQITKKICDVCSPRENGYQTTSDYTLSDTFKNKEYERLEDGSFKRDKNNKLIPKKTTLQPKKYFYSIDLANKKLATEWGKVVAEKTKKYFANL